MRFRLIFGFKMLKFIIMSRCHPGITDRRLKDKRFLKTEGAILKVVFLKGDFISIDGLAKTIGIARSTFYHHHRAISKIVVDYRNYALNKYSRLMKKTTGRASAKMLYRRMLIFIIQNKRVFKILMACGDKEIFIKLIGKIKPRLVKLMGLPKNSDKLFLVYTGEIAALLEAWCKSEEYEMEKVLDEITYLTQTARVRLKMLLG